MTAYNKQGDSIIGNVDWFTIILYLLLVVMGWVSIYGASYDYDSTKEFYDLSTRSGSQLLWIGTSLIIAFIILKIDSDLFDVFAYYIYAIFILLLVITIFFAPDIKGSRSWLVITNSIRLQPAEFAKFATALALAKWMSKYNFQLLTAKNLLVIGLIIFLPFILIILQNETGSALVYASFILVLYRESLPGIVLLLVGLAATLFVVDLKFNEVDYGYSITQGEFLCILIICLFAGLFMIYFGKESKLNRKAFAIGVLVFAIPITLKTYNLLPFELGIVALVALSSLFIYLLFMALKKWSKVYLFIATFLVLAFTYVTCIDYLFPKLQPHQQTRINLTLGKYTDALGAGYNVNQSKIAIGSGGTMGKGFLNGTQTKLKYVPEQDTDFIFCTVGEEHGFIGSSLVLLIFAILLMRLIFLAEKQRTVFARVYGYSVISILFFHIAINIGMVLGITPVIGIPLPFFSYGGSSLWAFTILLFIFLRLDMSRKRKFFL